MGLIYLLTYLEKEMGQKVIGKIAKSGMDFDNYGELIQLLDLFKPDVMKRLSAEASVNSRSSEGGTSARQVALQLRREKARIK